MKVRICHGHCLVELNLNLDILLGLWQTVTKGIDRIHSFQEAGQENEGLKKCAVYSSLALDGLLSSAAAISPEFLGANGTMGSVVVHARAQLLSCTALYRECVLWSQIGSHYVVAA